MEGTFTPRQMVALLNLKGRLNANFSTAELIELLRPDFHVGKIILKMSKANYTEKFQNVTVFDVDVAKKGFKYTTRNLSVLTPRKSISFTAKDINEFIATHNKKRRREE